MHDKSKTFGDKRSIYAQPQLRRIEVGSAENSYLIRNAHLIPQWSIINGRVSEPCSRVHHKHIALSATENIMLLIAINFPCYYYKMFVIFIKCLRGFYIYI